MACLKIKMLGVFALPFLLYAIAGYAEQNILDINNRDNIPLLSKALFLDITFTGKHMVAVGERGHVLVSQDGKTWKKSDDVPANTTLTSVYFHDDNYGWAVGHDAVILKSKDGGKQWRQVYAHPEEETPLLDIWFADDQYGIAIGAYGLYLVSTDGGESWINEEMNITEKESPAAGDLAASYELHLNSIANSSSGKLYIAAEAGRIYRSDDQGKNWKTLSSPYAGSFFGVQPLADDSVLVYGLRGHLYRSDDAGENWSGINIDTREHLTGSTILKDGRIIITGMGGVLLISDDQGLSFKLQELGLRHNYSAVIESGKDNIIMTGDHGIELWSRQQQGIHDD